MTPPQEREEATRTVGEGQRGISSAALEALSTGGPPVALATALLVYFGWVRTKAQAQWLGYDSQLLDLSIQDYILKSVNVLYVPSILILVLGLALRQVHTRLVVPAVDGRPSRALTWVIRPVRMSFALWLVCGVGVVLAAPSLKLFVVPGVATLTCLGALYAAALDRAPARPTMSMSVRVFTLVILAFSVFWLTERIAWVTGTGFAEQIAARPGDLAAVTVYSPKSLNIDVVGIVETKLGIADASYLYRYDGMRLVQRSGDRYFLISEVWGLGRPRVLLLRESDAIRVEFSR